MPIHACRFCGAVGAVEENEDEAKAAALAAGFIFIPVADPLRPLFTMEHALCGHCAKYVRSYVLAESGATAADVLEPIDEAFENDTGW